MGADESNQLHSSVEHHWIQMPWKITRCEQLIAQHCHNLDLQCTHPNSAQTQIQIKDQQNSPNSTN
jgi:hypothetical protein